MTSTAVHLGTRGVDASFGAGRIDVKQALGLTLAQVNTPELSLAKADPVALVDQRTAPLQSAARMDRSIAAIDALVLNIPVSAEWKMTDQLRAQADVEYAEPDYTLHLLR